jgi:hypothetical protein
VGSPGRFHGGTIWSGEAGAIELTREIVAAADRDGRLSGIVDAIRSHRVEEDFSPIWSRAREDLERKLYRKRSKVQPVFIELYDTVPTHGPESEVTDRVAWQHFFTLLDKKEKRIVICLRSGPTTVGDIARELGYPYHSPISKRRNSFPRPQISQFDITIPWLGAATLGASLGLLVRAPIARVRGHHSQGGDAVGKRWERDARITPSDS